MATKDDARGAEGGGDAELSDEDLYEALHDVSGYLDVTPADLREVYRLAYRHAAERLSVQVRARDVMARDVAFVAPEAPLRLVVELMARRGVSGVPVVDRDRRILGVLSEKDLFVHLVPGGATTALAFLAELLAGSGPLCVELRGETAEELMTSPAVSVHEDATLGAMAELLGRRGINRLPVTDDEGKLVGIVTRGDVVRASRPEVGG